MMGLFIFYFFGGWKKIREEQYFMTHENHKECKCQCSQKMSWNRATFIHVLTAAFVFIGRVEHMRQRPYGPQKKKNIFVISPLTKMLNS